MPDQLFRYYIENPLVIVSISVGVGKGGGVVIRIDVEIWAIGKGGIKRGKQKRGDGGRGMSPAEFCGSYVC
jgi:hypothetical protein